MASVTYNLIAGYFHEKSEILFVRHSIFSKNFYRTEI